MQEPVRSGFLWNDAFVQENRKRESSWGPRAKGGGHSTRILIPDCFYHRLIAFHCVFGFPKSYLALPAHLCHLFVR